MQKCIRCNGELDTGKVCVNCGFNNSALGFINPYTSGGDVVPSLKFVPDPLDTAQKDYDKSLATVRDLIIESGDTKLLVAWQEFIRANDKLINVWKRYI